MTEIIKYISIFFYAVLLCFLIYTANLKCLCAPWLAHEQKLFLTLKDYCKFFFFFFFVLWIS